jgi:hypothetical protein
MPTKEQQAALDALKVEGTQYCKGRAETNQQAANILSGTAGVVTTAITRSLPAGVVAASVVGGIATASVDAEIVRCLKKEGLSDAEIKAVVAPLNARADARNTIHASIAASQASAQQASMRMQTPMQMPTPGPVTFSHQPSFRPAENHTSMMNFLSRHTMG